MITGPEPGLTRDCGRERPRVVGPRRCASSIPRACAARRRSPRRPRSSAASDAIRAIRFAEVVVLLLDAERPFENQDLHDRRSRDAGGPRPRHRGQQMGSRGGQAAHAQGAARDRGAAAVAGAGRGLGRHIGAERAWARPPARAPCWTPTIPGTGASPLPISTAGWRRRLQQHSPPAVSGRRIKIRYMTQVSARPPTFVAFCSRGEALPQSYIRYLSNSLREAFRLPGVPLRFNLRKGDNPYAKGKR